MPKESLSCVSLLRDFLELPESLMAKGRHMSKCGDRLTDLVQTAFGGGTLVVLSITCVEKRTSAQ